MPCSRVLRRAGLPLLLVGAVVVSLTARGGDAPEPADAAPAPSVAPLEDPLLSRTSPEQAAQLDALWAVWGDDLAGRPGTALPDGLATVPFEEALYVLLSTRAAQLAAALAAQPDAPPAAAAAASGLAAEPAGVTVTRTPSDLPGCVALRADVEPLGRTFYASWPGRDEPGPEPQGPLERVLLRTARVGLLPDEAATCGLGAVAYSPVAQLALQGLAPRLLVP